MITRIFFVSSSHEYSLLLICADVSVKENNSKPELDFHFKSHASASRSDEQLKENKVAGLCSIKNYEPS